MATSVNGDVSLVLSRILDSYGLDEDTRQRRMDAEKINQLLSSWGHESLAGNGFVLLSGSAYETTTIDGLSSDVDKMIVSTTHRVIDNIQHWTPDASVPTYMMDNTGCYPAFVKLYLLSSEYSGPLYSHMVSDIPEGHVVDENKKLLLCNDHFGRVVLAINASEEPHGPALTLNMGLDVDYVITLTCKSFPREAEHWKHRQTNDTRARIGGAILDQASNCYIVAVGCKRSKAENTEWRLSFSHIENELVHAWNNVQYKCYVMMKFILKDLIKPNVPDCILCSYHFKTTLMWMVEEYPAEFFIESNLGKCVLAVLNNLATCVTRKSLPHYFVQGCNLFYNSLDEKSSKHTVAVIETIISTWPSCLCDIKRRKLGKQFRSSLLQQVPLNTVCEFNIQCRLEHFCHYDPITDTARYLYQLKFRQSNILRKQHKEVFKLLHKLVQRSKQPNFYYMGNKQFVAFIVKDYLCCVGLQLLRHTDTMTNKAALHYKRLGLGCIRRCINDCCFDTELQIAEYFTRVRNYQRALLLLDNVESRIKPHSVYYCYHPNCDEKISTSHTAAMFNNKPSLHEFCKYYCAVPVTYFKDNLPHVPRPLVYEMFRTTVVSPPVLETLKYYWYYQAVIHCSVYLYYLRFLCFHALGRYAHRQVALDNVAWALRQLDTSTGTHAETNHNILGDCYRTLGQLHRAYREYRKSLLKQKYHNAAIWHLALLVRRKVRSDL